MNQFQAELEEIYTGSQAGFPSRWTACNFFDKVIFATGSTTPQYWPKGGRARPVPGLPDDTGWDGAEEFGGHVLLWKGERLKWCDLNDFTMWIPVAATAISLSVDTVTDFPQPTAGSTTDWIHVDEHFFSFVVGQYVRIDLSPDDPTTATYNFYTVADAANPAGKISVTEDFSQNVPESGAEDSENATIFCTTYVEWPTGARVIVNGNPVTLEITGTSRFLSPIFTSAVQSEPVPSPGGTFHIQIAENPSTLKVGDILSIGNIATTGLDLYLIVTVAFNLELKRLDIGTRKQALNYRFPVGTFLTFQPFFKATNYGPNAVVIDPKSDISIQGAVKLLPTGYTGEIPEGTTVPSGSTIQSVDANEAGETVNAGAQINGDIFAIVTLGEYALILKIRSLQTLQYVGATNGVFFARTAVQDEGPISRYAWTRITEGNKIVFWGHKEIYEYGGDLILTPIGIQHTPDVFKELDRSRADEIVTFHNERALEVWFVYPTLAGETKVLIYNYREKSVVVDFYDADINGITALGAIDWEVAPAWQDLDDSQIWSTETKKWYEYVEDGEQRYTVIAIGGTDADPNLGETGTDPIPRLLLHGRVFTRSAGDNCGPAAYLCKAETQDYDFGDGDKFKYVDTINLNLEIRDQLTSPMKLWVQIGSRKNLDADIAWSTPSSIEASGSGNFKTQVNIRSSGRFHRVRFFSNSKDAQWRVAGFELIARLGGTN